jgi:DNA-directed RNA polymerase subunit E'/Rpb7
MEKIFIEKRICLHSKYLDQDIQKNIFLKLEELTNNECTKEDGYIININKDIDILDHKIGRANTDNIFTIKFEATILKPKEGLKVTGIVCMVYKDGIFINILDRQKMLIPKAKLQDYNFDENKKQYTDKNKNIIKLGQKIEAIMTGVVYNNKTFSCFGSIV